jgi:class 3 adenylate cyclase
VAYFIDVHEGADQPEGRPSLAEIEEAHARDLAAQERFGVRFVGFYLNPASGTASCVAEAPSIHAVVSTHVAAHGEDGRPARVMEISRDDLEGFLGGMRMTASGIALSDDGSELGSSFRTILFTDLERSVQWTQALGDVRAMDVLHRHDGVLRAALESHHGREVKHTGDGIMASFRSASDAVAASIWAQRQFISRSGEPPGPLNVRIGISAGEPVSERGDLFGSAVQLAARLCGRAEPGEVLVSAAVRELCTAQPIPFVDCGMCELKGFAGPVHHFSVDWRSETPSTVVRGSDRERLPG